MNNQICLNMFLKQNTSCHIFNGKVYSGVDSFDFVFEDKLPFKKLLQIRCEPQYVCNDWSISL